MSIVQLDSDIAAELLGGCHVITIPGDRKFITCRDNCTCPRVAPERFRVLDKPCERCKNHRVVAQAIQAILGDNGQPLCDVCGGEGREVWEFHTRCGVCVGNGSITGHDEEEICFDCGGNGSVFVARASVRLLPVAMIVAGPRPYSMFIRDDGALVLRGAHPDKSSSKFIGYWPNDTPLPSVGSDWVAVFEVVS